VERDLQVRLGAPRSDGRDHGPPLQLRAEDLEHVEDAVTEVANKTTAAACADASPHRHQSAATQGTPSSSSSARRHAAILRESPPCPVTWSPSGGAAASEHI